MATVHFVRIRGRHAEIQSRLLARFVLKACSHASVSAAAIPFASACATAGLQAARSFLPCLFVTLGPPLPLTGCSGASAHHLPPNLREAGCFESGRPGGSLGARGQPI